MSSKGTGQSNVTGTTSAEQTSSPPPPPPLTARMTAALEKLSALQEMRGTHVQISMPSDVDSLDVVLSPNLIIRSIKTTSCALFKLIIGDQILNINGIAPATAEEALEMIRNAGSRFLMLVNRPLNREPVVMSRAMSIQLKRMPGFAYFVVHLQRVDKVHLGLGIRSYRNKIIVNRTDENSLAAFGYLVGDSIIDVNCERINDVAVLQRRMIDSLVKYGHVNTVVERSEAAIMVNNTRVSTAFLLSTGSTDPPMPGDVMCIAQRELVRFKANANKKVSLKSVYKRVEPIRDYGARSEEETPPNTTSDPAVSEARDGDTGASGFQRFNMIAEKTIRRKKRDRKITINLKPSESTIASDVQNTIFLQKIPSNQRATNALTFMPKMFMQGFQRNKNGGEGS